MPLLLDLRHWLAREAPEKDQRKSSRTKMFTGQGSFEATLCTVPLLLLIYSKSEYQFATKSNSAKDY
eukprot:3043269-Amphidinium_carterae.1